MHAGSQHPSLAESILKALVYYDIFSYPLTPYEVFRFLPSNGVTEEDVSSELIALSEQSVIFKIGRFFSIQNDPTLSDRRENGNALASARMKKARQRARLIGHFPFIRGVLVSGSLSKGFMDETSDIDFFIITEPGRLWIARTLLVLFKRIFLRNSHRYFCVNYFIDSDHLEIEEKNLFTATELATLIPMVNAAMYTELLGKNRWIKSFFPNYTSRLTDDVPPARTSAAKRALEGAINLVFGAQLEAFFKQATYRRWRKMYEHTVSSADFDIAFKTNDHTSKGHPRNYQRKVIDLYQRKLEALPAFKEVISRA